MRGTKTLLGAVIVMGVMIVLATAVLISTVVRRAMHSGLPAVAAQQAQENRLQPAQPTLLALGQPSGTRIVSVARQADTLLSVVLAGGGIADRVLIWDIATGKAIASLTLDR